MNRESAIRTLAGFAIAPIAPGLLMTAGSLLIGKWYGSFNWIAMASTAGYPTALLLGIPAFLFMQWKGWTGARAYAMAGALLGLAPSFVVVMAVIDIAGGVDALGSDRVQSLGLITAIGLVCGIVGGLSFWLIARPTGFTKGLRLDKQHHP